MEVLVAEFPEFLVRHNSGKERFGEDLPWEGGPNVGSIAVKDSNMNMQAGKDSPVEVLSVGHEDLFVKQKEENGGLADLEEIVASLEQGEGQEGDQQDLSLTKSLYGCSWGRSGQQSCGNRPADCPFVSQLLGLEDVRVGGQDHDPSPGQMQRVLVLRQTSQGLVKVQETLYHLGEARDLQSLSPREQAKQLGLSLVSQDKARTSYSSTGAADFKILPEANYTGEVQASNKNTYKPYRAVEVRPNQRQGLEEIYRQNQILEAPYKPPPNSVLVKVPISSRIDQQVEGGISFNSTATSHWSEETNTSGPLFCSECDTQFLSKKALAKHTRNQHLVYQCSRCGDQTVGYYRMASHTKKSHSREPTFFCPCGRNFAEKKGMSKHQNTCSFS